MSDDSLRAKQERLQLGTPKVNDADKASYTEENSLSQNRQLAEANPEWRRFYEIIKQITKEMRD
ncbi:hypothetical protein FHS15_002071 [Paenibacillus castaneae]|uniref:hypothetical protein n=1 Tax=Paenibacillus castaneae TaxID=474957 RepID=UPI000C9C0B34|nr:hypothetical protein [Paenibacillus castaneae]NIK76946.1 hypothetical protein [Paenibacillus castaneae]